MTNQNAGYLDFQAEVGISKHLGGIAATDELLALCRVAEAREVLYAGCGIGVGPAYIARKHGCRVVGVDISPRMIEWCHVRARMAKVEDHTEFQVADILDLPFDSGRFDAVLVESVVAFVTDRAQAIRELVRVARPGGWVGINETFAYSEVSPEMQVMIRSQLGVDVPTLDAWQALWDASGLQERSVKAFKVDSRKQVRSQIQWVGFGWMLKAFWRLFKLYRAHPAVRDTIRQQFSSGVNFFDKMGYGLFAGRK